MLTVAELLSESQRRRSHENRCSFGISGIFSGRLVDVQIAASTARQRGSRDLREQPSWRRPSASSDPMTLAAQNTEAGVEGRILRLSTAEMSRPRRPRYPVVLERRSSGPTAERGQQSSLASRALAHRGGLFLVFGLPGRHCLDRRRRPSACGHARPGRGHVGGSAACLCSGRRSIVCRPRLDRDAGELFLGMEIEDCSASPAGICQQPTSSLL